jgi:hypothetical protein
MSKNPQKRWRWAAGAGLTTFALHGLIALWLPLPSFRKYSLAAEQYLTGALPQERLMDFSPLYFHLSVLLERLVGQPEKVLEWLQIGLAALAVGLFGLLLLRRFPRPLALGALLVMMLDRHLLVYTRILEPEALLLFLVLVVLVALQAEHRAAPLVAGLAAGLALATRPTFLPVFLLVPLYFRWRATTSGEENRRWRHQGLIFALPVLTALLLLAARAQVLTGNFRAPLMNPGTVFFEGNNALSHGTSAKYPPVVLNFVRHAGYVPDSAHQHYRAVARAAAGRHLSIAEVNSFWFDRTLAYLRAEPGRAVALWAEKLGRVFHGFSWHDIPSAWVYDQRLPLPTLSFALLAALALPGALFEARRWRQSRFFYVLAGSQISVMVVFYVSARQRLILLPAALYFAAVTLEWMVQKRFRALPLLLLVAFLTLSLSLPDDPQRDEVRQRQSHLATDRLVQEIIQLGATEPLAHHAHLAVQAVVASPWWLDGLNPAFFPRHRGSLQQQVVNSLTQASDGVPSIGEFDLAEMELRVGRVKSAEQRLTRLVDAEIVVYRGSRQTSLPRMLLGRARALLGDSEGGVRVLQEALERSPGEPFVLSDLFVLTQDPFYRERLDAYWSGPDVHYLLGRAFLAHGRNREAAQELTTLVDQLGDFRDARVLLAAALGGVDEIDAAAKHFLKAMRQVSEPLLEEEAIVDIFRRWSAAHPESFEAQLFAARVLHHHGYFREALGRFQNLSIPPGRHIEVAQEIDTLQQELSPASGVHSIL